MPAAPLFGRERELDELEAALAETREGRGGLVLVAGEPGIGKTRLAEAAAERAGEQGFLVLWARCWESGGAPAFWPWIQVLRALVRHQNGDLGENVGWIAHLVPELREQRAAIEAPPSLDSDQARFALFDATATYLGAASAKQPLLLAVDDVHAADQASLLLLDFVARTLRDTSILFLGTYQPAVAQMRPEVGKLLGSLARVSRELPLGGFGEEELARMVEHHGGGGAPPELVRALRRTTEGNPFFASETIRLLAAEGDLASAPTFPLPDTVRETIRRRFEPLGEDGVERLEIAAVIGREFTLATLAPAAGMEPAPLIRLLDEAGAAGLVVGVPGAVGRFRFTHGLIRETLYAGLSAARRGLLHKAVGEAIERASGAAAEHLSELAHHFAEAAPLGDADKALDYAVRAGRHAMQLLAYEQAAELFELALATSELLEPDLTRRAELVLALAQARLRGGDPRGRETVIQAAEGARTAGRPDLLAAAALEIRGYAAVLGGVDDVHIRLLEEALESTEGDDALRARLMARLAMALYYRPGTAGRREALVEEALSTARELDDPGTLAYVLNNGQLGTMGPDTTERDLAWSAELLHLAEEAGETALAVGARSRQIDFLLEVGDVAGADNAIEALERVAAEKADPRGRAWVPLQLARRALMEGRFADAERLNSELGEVAGRLEDSFLGTLAAAQLFFLRWSEGRLAEIAELTRRFASASGSFPAWRAGLARAYLEMGRDAEARGELDGLAARDFGEVPRYNGWLLTMALLSEVCEGVGDSARAATLYELLSPFAERNVVAHQAAFLGPVPRYLGLLSAACGDASTASANFAAARARAGALGARPMVALTAMDEARLLASQGESARADELLGEAAAIGGELGAEGLLARVEGLRRSLEPRAATTQAEPMEAAAARLRREGDVWTFEYEQRALRMRDSRGVHHLAALLASPGVEIHALDLAGSAVVEDDTGPVLDSEAKAAYRSRLEDLRDEIEEAEAFNDPERATRARQEMDQIASELSGAVGLGGRDRRRGASAERARVNVTRAIRSVVKRIAEQDPALGRELEATVRTGTFCCYEPDVRRPVEWRVETG